MRSNVLPARNLRSLCTIAVLAHLLVSLTHGYAHTQLGVGLSLWQQLYVSTVITLAPLVAIVLLWARQTKSAFLVLTISMAGSLIFGGYYHYLLVSPDHVSHLPAGDERGLFRLTAALLLVTELFGLIVGLFGLRQVYRTGANRPDSNDVELPGS